MFKHVLLFSIERSELSQSINEFSKVSNLSPFARLISSLKCQCNMSRLAKKIMRWFDESKGNEKSFDYRFTGQESRRFLHNFMYMISAIEGENDSRQDCKCKDVQFHTSCSASIADIMYIKLWRNLRDSCPVNL